jgi:dUTP pyrophosphatase
MQLHVELTSDLAVLPKRGTTGSAGYDIVSVEDVIVSSGQRVAVPTGLKIMVPEGTYGRIAPRSGLALKHGLDVLAGVIDSDYRGEVAVILLNTGTKDYEVKKGDRIAQLVLERIVTPEVMQVPSVSSSCRGEGGFGSTGR